MAICIFPLTSFYAWLLRYLEDSIELYRLTWLVNVYNVAVYYECKRDECKLSNLG